MKKKTKLISLLLVLALALVGCGKSSNNEGEAGGSSNRANKDNIIYSVDNAEPETLDPGLAQGTHESWILQHLYTGLMTYDKEGKVVPGMAAKDPEISEDGLTYTFTLKDDVKWSNGDPVTAEDFAYSWTRVLNPETASIYAYQLFYVKGGEAYNSVKKPGTYYVKDAEGNDTAEVDEVVEYTDADLKGLDVAGKSEDEIAQLVYEKWLDEKAKEVGIKVIDDKTLEVTLEEPTAYFTELTAFYTLYPVNQKVVEGNKDWAKNAETYVCNGPFKLDNWEHDAKIELSKNDNWYDADNVKIDGIHWDILEERNTAWEGYDGGKYDLIVDPPTNVIAESTESKNPELVIGNQAGTYYFNLNTRIKPFDNVNVRKALSMAIDRETITSKVTQGGQIPATGVVPAGIHDETGEDYIKNQEKFITENPEEAKKLLEKGLKEAGATMDDINGKVILYNTSESHKKIAEVIQQMWKNNLGIDVQLENADFNVKLAREKSGDYDISRAGWVGDYADPMTMIDLFVTDGPFNDSGYSNAKYDALVKAAKSSNDQKVRMEAMREAEKILMSEMPIVPIYFYTQPYFVKSYVEGVTKPLILYPSFTYAEIK